MKQFTKIIEFRQYIYEHAFTRERDAQFELLDGGFDKSLSCYVPDERKRNK